MVNIQNNREQNFWDNVSFGGGLAQAVGTGAVIGTTWSIYEGVQLPVDYETALIGSILLAFIGMLTNQLGDAKLNKLQGRA